MPEPCQETPLQVAVSYKEVGLKEFLSLVEAHMSWDFCLVCLASPSVHEVQIILNSIAPNKQRRSPLMHTVVTTQWAAYKIMLFANNTIPNVFISQQSTR